MEKEDKEFLERIAKEIVERSMTAPAVLLLETAKPFNRIGHQFMIFMEPIIQSFLAIKEYQRVRDLLEDRENIEYLIRAIEDLENSRERNRG